LYYNNKLFFVAKKVRNNDFFVLLDVGNYYFLCEIDSHLCFDFFFLFLKNPPVSRFALLTSCDDCFSCEKFFREIDLSSTWFHEFFLFFFLLNSKIWSSNIWVKSIDRKPRDCVCFVMIICCNNIIIVVINESLFFSFNFFRQIALPLLDIFLSSFFLIWRQISNLNSRFVWGAAMFTSRAWWTGEVWAIIRS